MKKGQAETIGLVVIVALLAFILVFVLQINFKNDVTKLNSRYFQLQADNLRSTILKQDLCSDVNLGDLNIQDEIVNCNNGYPVCFFSDCKTELKDKIRKIIEKSLFAKRYSFEAGEIKVEKNFDKCGNETYTAVEQPIYNADFTIKLKLC